LRKLWKLTVDIPYFPGDRQSRDLIQSFKSWKVQSSMEVVLLSKGGAFSKLNLTPSYAGDDVKDDDDEKFCDQAVQARPSSQDAQVQTEEEPCSKSLCERVSSLVIQAGLTAALYAAGRYLLSPSEPQPPPSGWFG
jgi:hypothetical protein